MDTSANLYKDATKKCLFYPRVSINPPLPYKMPDKIAQHIGNDLFNKLRNYREWNGITNENKRYKNMNRKNTIRLTESELKNIITESVKNILREDSEMEGNAPNKEKDNYKRIFSIRAWSRKINSIVSGLENALRNGRLEDPKVLNEWLPQVIENLRFVASNIEDDALALKENNKFNF